MRLFKNILLMMGATFFAWLICELVIGIGITPHPGSGGKFLGYVLPPIKTQMLSSGSDHAFKPDKWYRNLIVKAKKITSGDLWGIERDDETLGYAPRENSISKNGWWQINALGARNRRNFTRAIPDSKKRILVFGDSFAVSSRVPQEEMWSSFLAEIQPDVEVVNFGVDGYNMCQSFLRYEKLQFRLDHSLVLLVFVPTADLWREINVYRGLRGWKNYVPTPRFILEKNQLELIPSPYRNWGEFFDENSNGLSGRFKKFLLKYDRFYFLSEYNESFWLEKSNCYKLLAKYYYAKRTEKLQSSLLDPQSEAMRISREIFKAMQQKARDAGSLFLLVLLPTHQDVLRYRKDIPFDKKWDEMVLSIRKDGISFADLMEEFLNVEEKQLDQGWDGSHYGKRANRLIAKTLQTILVKRGIL